MKRLVAYIDNELHHKMRIRAAMQGMTIRKYITSLIETDLERAKKEEYPAQPTKA